MPYSGRIHFFTFLKYENICKWYEKLTKNSNFDKNKNEKQQQHQRQEKKHTIASQRQWQHYDIRKIWLTLETGKKWGGRTKPLGHLQEY